MNGKTMNLTLGVTFYLRGEILVSNQERKGKTGRVRPLILVFSAFQFQEQDILTSKGGRKKCKCVSVVTLHTYVSASWNKLCSRQRKTA